MAKKKSFKKEMIQEQSFQPESSVLIKFLNSFSAVFLLLFVIFIWSYSTLVFSGPIMDVCLRSRKLGNPYCFSIVVDSINYDIPLSLIENTTNMSGFHQGTINFVQYNTLKMLSFSSKTPSSTADNNHFSDIENVTQKSAFLSSNILTTELVKTQETESELMNLVFMTNVENANAEEMFHSRKVVEDQIAVLRSYIPKSKPLSCEGRGIYVYDLPPKFNKDIVAHCNEMMTWTYFCKYFTNDAMGEPIQELGKGWYDTHELSLEPIFHKRILKHSCRVENPEEAKIFYVPFYGALDKARCHFSKVQNDVNNSITLATELVEWLAKQKMWRRNSGLDHVFVLGKINGDFKRVESGHCGSTLLDIDEFENTVKILMERNLWAANEVGVPYLTSFHPISDEEIIGWQDHIRQVQRRNLISFAGAMHSRGNNIRPILIEQCTSAQNVCNFLNCGGEACVESSHVINLFVESEFCLQAPGDSPRKSVLFDSLVVGCIPVFFDHSAAHYQYPWHLPEDYKKYSVFIDQEAVKNSEVNVIEELVKIPLRKRQEMREYIIYELMPKLVYADADAKLEKFEDAISITVNNLLQMVISRLPRVGIQGY